MFRNLTAVATVLLVLVFSVSSAKASVITFDDHAGAGVGEAVENGYAGLNWENFYALNTVTYPTNPSGFENGVVSPDNVAYNGRARMATISSSTPFNLNSAYFTGGWRDNLTIRMFGYFDDVQQYTTSFQVDSTEPSLVTFNWKNLDYVIFASFNGDEHLGYIGTASIFVVDDLNVSFVPVPAALPLFGLGLAGVSGFGFKRRRKEKAVRCI